ncbi:MAG: hypothetical protein ACKOTB_08850 [Planctomycetia bacterium]
MTARATPPPADAAPPGAPRPSAAVPLTLLARRWIVASLSVAACGPAGISPPPESEVELSAVDGGITYKVHGGNAYRVDPRSGRWLFVQRIYDPEFRTKHYVERDGAVFRRDEGGLMPVRRSFSEGFEDASRLTDLIGFERGWTSFVLQSPQAPTVADYVALRKRILSGTGDFLDNRLEPSRERAWSGNASLKSLSLPATRGMITAKAALSTELLHFVKGDDVWIKLACFVQDDGGMPFTVLDLETTWIENQPGMRVMIADGRHVCLQLKSLGNPTYRQPKGGEVVFPRDRWVRLRVHLGLTDAEDGVIEAWQDDRKIIDTRGRTLVLAGAIYNSLEVGITAYDDRSRSATLYVDDVVISTTAITE